MILNSRYTLVILIVLILLRGGIPAHANDVNQAMLLKEKQAETFFKQKKYREAANSYEKIYENIVYINKRAKVKDLNEQTLIQLISILKKVVESYRKVDDDGDDVRGYVINYNQKMLDYLQQLRVKSSPQRQSDIYREQARLYAETRVTPDSYIHEQNAYQQALAIDKKIDNLNGVAVSLNGLGHIAEFQGDYQQALTLFQEALAIYQKLKNPSGIADSQDGLALLYDNWGEYSKAENYLKQSLAINQKLERESAIADNFQHFGILYTHWNRFDLASDYFEKALKLNQAQGRKQQMAANTLALQSIYWQLGKPYQSIEVNGNEIPVSRYSLTHGNFTIEYAQVYLQIGMSRNTGLSALKQALDTYQKIQNMEGIIEVEAQLGNYYFHIDDFKQALNYFEASLNKAKKTKLQHAIADDLLNIGQVYEKQGQYRQAFEQYLEAQTINQKLQREASLSLVYNGLGRIYYQWGQYENGIEYFQKALNIKTKKHLAEDIFDNNYYLALYHYYKNNYDQALQYLQKSLVKNHPFYLRGMIYRQLGNREIALSTFNMSLASTLNEKQYDWAAKSLNALGLIYQDMQANDKALEAFQEALGLEREIDARGNIAVTLNHIGSLYYQSDRCQQALEPLQEAVSILEQVRQNAPPEVKRDYLESQVHVYRNLALVLTCIGKYNQSLHTVEMATATQLADMLSHSQVVPLDINQLQHELPKDTFLLLYAPSTLADMNQIALTSQDIKGQKVPMEPILAPLYQEFKSELKEFDTHHISEITSSKEHIRNESDHLKPVILYYRKLLANPSSDPEKVKKIASVLYQLLIQPMKSYLNKAQEILVVPTGILGILPYETLLDEQGHYLVENYHIRYVQSLNVLSQLERRHYSNTRKPMLAFGGAVYNPFSYRNDMADSPIQLAALRNEVARGGSLRFAYRQLGLDNWSNLPGTLAEVKAIQGIVPDTDLKIAGDVTETAIKMLSKGGMLKQYKVLHFAVHGVVVPEEPGLSAIVLSQLDKVNQEDDGYLTMREIQQLDIQADLVNLSACETGLGKMYESEGIVGLTQAFLVAGANGLSVSLWEVSDQSTSRLMTEMYRNKIGYSQSLGMVKRQFIQGKFGEQYRHPYYWAPFVYYGS